MGRTIKLARKPNSRRQSLLKTMGAFALLCGAIAFLLELGELLPPGPAITTSIESSAAEASEETSAEPAAAGENESAPVSHAPFKLPPVAAPHTPFQLEPAFPLLKFNDPVFITSVPDGSGRVAVAERRGMIYAFDEQPDVASRTEFLDIRTRVQTTPDKAEEGLLGLAFHPAYNATGKTRRRWVFVYYTARVSDHRTNRLSRFEVPEFSSTVDPNSEVVLIDQPDRDPAHNAGSLVFGPDGFLYVALGDDHFDQENAQHIDRNFFSGILRIDVDQRGGDVSHAVRRRPVRGHSADYFIPNSNPFVGGDNLEEFYALGLRNPWRMSFDRGTGKLWVTDVGDKLREEINVVEKGDNCGWPYAEGSVVRHTVNPELPEKPLHLTGHERWPVFDYPRNFLHLAVIGGYVYRGHDLPQLTGQYIYADQTGRVYGLTLDKDNKVTDHTLLALLENPGLGVSSWGENERGELYLCNIADLNVEASLIYKLVRNTPAPGEMLPEKLSATGVFRNLAGLEPQPAFVPYQVNVPLFSDGADKQRWLALPPGKKIAGQLRDTWTYPAGTVFLKHFELPLDERKPKEVRRLETRVLIVKPEGGVYGASYRWNKEQTDAEVVQESTVEELTRTAADGTTRTQDWFYPGRFACSVCHTPTAGYVLGLNYKQLNRQIPGDQPGETKSQLLELRDRGLFATTFPDNAPASLTPLVPLDDTSASVEKRVISYLDANCSSCHRPGLRYSAFDTRLETRPENSGLIDGTAYHGFKKDGLEKIVTPGDLEHSMLYMRMHTNAAHMRMPPLGRETIDEPAAALVREWILSLPPLPAPQTPSPPAPPVAAKPGENAPR